MSFSRLSIKTPYSPNKTVHFARSYIELTNFANTLHALTARSFFHAPQGSEKVSYPTLTVANVTTDLTTTDKAFDRYFIVEDLPLDAAPLALVSIQ